MSTNVGRETHHVAHSTNSGTFLERFAYNVGNSATAATVFGDPVERGGITVIPVAKARWGVGGGAGSNPSDASRGEGTGGGAGVAVTPIGYIEVKDGRARFRPIYDPALLVRLLVAAGFVAMLVLRGVRRLAR